MKKTVLALAVALTSCCPHAPSEPRCLEDLCPRDQVQVVKDTLGTREGEEGLVRSVDHDRIILPVEVLLEDGSVRWYAPAELVVVP